MNLYEFFLYFDALLYVLFAILLFLILTQIAPRTYKFYKHKYFSVDSFDVSNYGYFTNGGFWKWLFSKQGRIDLYEDAKQQQVVFYNNFRIFNFFWKITFVLLFFRILVMFFGPGMTE